MVDNESKRNKEFPDVFLCHTWADKPWVRRLGELLEVESVDGTEAGRRIRVFFDEWDIDKGENIVARLGKALDSNAFVAVVMSPEFFESSWTEFEWTDVVARDPINKGGRILPIRLRDVSLDGSCRINIRAPFNALNYFDFRSDAQFDPVFEDFLRRIRNQPLPRGQNSRARYNSTGNDRRTADHFNVEEADLVDEILISNLAPVIRTPPTLFMAKTNLKTLADIPGDLKMEDITLSLWGGKLLTYKDIEDPECALNSIVDPYTIERIEFEKCITNNDISNQWLALANKVLARALRAKGISQDEKKRFFFLPGPHEKNRSVAIGSQKPREVAAKKKHSVSEQEFWVHYCANIRFRIIGNKLFLRVLPSYCFTYDGRQSLDAKLAGRYKILWGGKQDSATMLRQVLFWFLFLSEGREDIVLETGGEPICVSIMPTTAPVKFGVGSDHTRIKSLVDQPSENELAMVADSAEFSADEEDSLSGYDGEGEEIS